MKRTPRSIIRIVTAFFMAAALARPALATEGFASGLDLKGWCDNMGLDDVHWGLCVGSITAAHDVVMSYQGFGISAEAVCTKSNHARADVIEAVIAYMRENPDKLEHSLGDVVLTALVEKFPCQPST